VDTGNATLYIPRLGEEYAVWMGFIQPPSYFKVLSLYALIGQPLDGPLYFKVFSFYALIGQPLDGPLY
jgi:hypothetical protein